MFNAYSFRRLYRTMYTALSRIQLGYGRLKATTMRGEYSSPVARRRPRELDQSRFWQGLLGTHPELDHLRRC